MGAKAGGSQVQVWGVGLGAGRASLHSSKDMKTRMPMHILLSAHSFHHPLFRVRPGTRGLLDPLSLGRPNFSWSYDGYIGKLLLGDLVWALGRIAGLLWSLQGEGRRDDVTVVHAASFSRKERP